MDETLLTINSMSSFLVAHQRARGRTPEQVSALLRELHALDAGDDRDAVSRAYYATFAGERADELAALGERWFADLSLDVFHAGVADEVTALRDAGTYVVLVSGAPPATVAPVARALGADAWFATVQEDVDGVLTGVATDAVIGARKAFVVGQVTRERGVAADECVAYGDHASDLPMLESVGAGVVVGADPVLTAAAARHGWRTIPAAQPTPAEAATLEAQSVPAATVVPGGRPAEGAPYAPAQSFAQALSADLP